MPVNEFGDLNSRMPPVRRVTATEMLAEAAVWVGKNQTAENRPIYLHAGDLVEYLRKWLEEKEAAWSPVSRVSRHQDLDLLLIMLALHLLVEDMPRILSQLGSQLKKRIEEMERELQP